MGVKFGRKGSKAQQRECAELDERIERDQEHAAEKRGAKLRQHDAKETTPRAVTERARGLLQRGVEASQRRSDGEIDEGIIGAGDDQQRAGEILERKLKA